MFFAVFFGIIFAYLAIQYWDYVYPILVFLLSIVIIFIIPAIILYLLYLADPNFFTKSIGSVLGIFIVGFVIMFVQYLYRKIKSFF